MENPLLVQNEDKRLRISIPLLFCFATFKVWQIGIIYFSGQTLSFYGRTPLPVTPGNMSLQIAISYFFSISFIYFFPRFIMYAGRFVTGMALMSALALYLPLPENILLTVFIFHCYCCVFMIGVENALITYLFKRETAARHLTLAYALAAFIIAFLHNDILPVSFSVFEFFMVFATALLLFFFCKMPAKVWPCYAMKKDGFTCPRRFFVMVYALGTIGGLIYLSGTTIAETVPHGLFVYYCASAAGSALVFVIWKRFGIPVLRIGYGCVGFTVLGFFLALLSLHIPVLALPACAVISIGGIVCWLAPLLTLILAKLYPARFIVPVALCLALIFILIYSSLLEALRDNIQFLYAVYIVIAAGLSVLYLTLEPYLTFTLREKIPFAPGTSLPETDAPGRSASIQKSASVEPRQNLPTTLQTPAFDNLTGQELRVAELVLRGHSYTEIAKTLKLKPSTIKTHQRNIYSKMQINSKRELFAIAEKAQWH